MTVAGLVYWIVMPAFKERPQNMFYVSSGLMLVGSGYFLWRLRGTGILLGPKRETQTSETEEQDQRASESPGEGDATNQTEDDNA